jgi:hypothetical protein
MSDPVRSAASIPPPVAVYSIAVSGSVADAVLPQALIRSWIILKPDTDCWVRFTVGTAISTIAKTGNSTVTANTPIAAVANKGWKLEAGAGLEYHVNLAELHADDTGGYLSGAADTNHVHLGVVQDAAGGNLEIRKGSGPV